MSLPDGFHARLRHDLICLEGGRFLLGGSPLCGLRLPRSMPALLAGDSIVVVDETSRALAARLLASDLATPASAHKLVEASRLTVIIPVKDRPAALDRALTALGDELSVIVVDDGSRHPKLIEQVVTAHQGGYIRLPANRGPAAARNAGLAQVASEFVAFVDSDVEVSGRSLQRLASYFDDPRVAAVAPRVRGRATSTRPRWFERYDAVASSLDQGSREGLVRPGAAVSYVPSACVLVRRRFLDGGFDESMRVGEDVDLVWRLVSRGHHVRYAPWVIAHHDARTTVGGWLRRKVAYGTSAAALASRHGSAVAPARLTPTIAFAAALLLLRNPRARALAVITLIPTRRRLHKRLPPGAQATKLTAQSAYAGVRQESALLLRHWWPLTALLLPKSRTVRHIALLAFAVDTAAVVLEHPGIDVTGATVGKRLDDIGYGTGLWLGCIKARTFRALVPHLA